MLQLKMLSYLNFVLLHIILFSTKTTGSNICRVSFPVTDHILTGHVIRTLQYKTFESCTFSCELEPRCFSVNYLHGTCQLNNATVVYFPEDVVKQKGAIYIEMVIRCVTGFSGLRCEKRKKSLFKFRERKPQIAVYLYLGYMRTAILLSQWQLWTAVIVVIVGTHQNGIALRVSQALTLL